MGGWCILTDALPEYIDVGGNQIKIDTRASTAIDCSARISSGDPDVIKLQYVCKRFGVPVSIEGFKAAVKFIQGPGESKKSARPSEKVMDYIQDADLIISAFQQTYSMQYSEVVSLHWWHFLALFHGLPHDTRIMEVIRIRSMTINPKDSADEKRRKRELKKAVALKDTRTTTQRKDDVQRQFNELGL